MMVLVFRFGNNAGFHTILISGRNALCVHARAAELNIKHSKTRQQR